MWKKTLFVGLLSVGCCAAITGCHHEHPENDQPAMTNGEEGESQETQITVDQLPPAVVQTVNKHVPDGTIVSAESMMWKGKQVYEIDVKSGDTVYELRIHKNGKFISKNIDKD